MAWPRRMTHGATCGALEGGYQSLPQTYRSWITMRRRCSDVKATNYKHYGGRGIRVCDEWRDDYAAFLRDVGACPPGHTLDRIDSNRHYEPGNVRWANHRTQVRNTRRVNRITYKGELMSSPDACEAAGINRGSLRQIAWREKKTHQEVFERLLTRKLLHSERNVDTPS